MSTDIRLMYRCPHVTFEELVSLDSIDLRTALSKQPVAGGYVRVTANNNVIPSQGLYAPAKLYAAVAEPYGIISGETSFSLITSQESITVNLPVSSRGRTSAAAIIAFLQPLLTTATIEVSNGYLVITDTAIQGTQSFVEVAGDAASALGFIEQRGATGRKVYPGWQLIQRGTTPRRYVQFTEKFKTNPILKLSYTVAQNQCLRCRGTGVENDMRFNEQGEILTIRNENLLYQGSLKILLTVKGSNPYHTFYGTRIKDRIGSKAVGAVAAAIREDIIRALGYYKQFQQEQGKYQQVTLKETLYEIASVQVNPAPNDPTVYYVDVVVRNASSEPVSLSIVYTVPGATALMGD
jgi:hypothetical protein